MVDPDHRGDCVEVAHTLQSMRDSKNPDGPTLDVNLRALLAAIKDDRPRA